MAQIGTRTINDISNSSEIVKHLFFAELTRLDDVLNKLIDQNDRIHGIDISAGFMYQGEYYLRSNASRAPTYGERLMLNPELWEKMNNYLKAASRLVMEVHLVNQTVFRLVRGCMTYQDVRDALPECLVVQDQSGRYKGLGRTREAAWTLDGDKRALEQYEKILPSIEYYAAAHLIF